MPRLASTLFATIVITLGGEQLQSAELNVLQVESAADPFSAGPPQFVPKKPEQPGIAEPPVERVSCGPGNASAQRVQSISAEPAAEAAARARIESELSATTQFDYLDLALRDAIRDIAVRHDLPIVFDAGSLEDVGIDSSTPVTLTLKRTTLRSALRLLLRDLDLTYVIRNEVLMITTRDVAMSQLSTRFYRASEAIPTREDMESITVLLMESVAPESWDSVGGAGHAAYLPSLSAWAVTQQDDVFPEIDGFFAAILRLSEQANRKP